MAARLVAVTAVLSCASAIHLSPRAALRPRVRSVHIVAVESWYDSGVLLVNEAAPVPKAAEVAAPATSEPDSGGVSPIAVGAGLLVAAGAAFFVLNGGGGETAPAVSPAVVSKPAAPAPPPAAPPARPAVAPVAAVPVQPAEPQVLSKEEKLARAKAAAAAAKAEYEKEIVEFKPNKLKL